MREKGFSSEVAGDFTTGCSAHAIADDKGSCGRCCGAEVLVGSANAALVSEHGEYEFVRWHGLVRNIVRRKQYTLER